MIIMYILLGIYLLGHLLFLPFEIVFFGFLTDPTLILVGILYLFALIFKYATIVFIFIICAEYKILSKTWETIYAIVMFIAILLNAIIFLLTLLNLKKFGFDFQTFATEPLFYDFVIYFVIALYGIIWDLLLLFASDVGNIPYTYASLPQQRVGHPYLQVHEMASIPNTMANQYYH